MKIRIIWSALSVLLVAAGCNSEHGPDSIFDHKPLPHGTVSMCVQCHTSANSPAMDPLVSNGSGTSGKHVKHFQERRIACERCHFNYLNALTHMNGTFDTGNPAVNVVNLNIIGGAGLWTNDTGTGTGGCTGVACHGTDTLDWYGSGTWMLPACTTCHSSGYSADLDPVVTNGNPPAGRHEKHVASRDIACERCHYNYPSILTHANGVLDTPDPAVNIVRFSVVGPSASWINDAGAQTGDCATVACHASNTLGWYGTGAWTLPAACTTCHSSGYSSVLDPLATNGSGLSGKHVRHVTSFSFACSKCHLNYPTRASHANGVMSTPDPAALLVYFDSTNPSGTWTNDTGPQTGNCSSMNCHAAPDPAWYELAGVSLPPCSVCHVNAVGVRRVILGPGGDFGQNASVKSHHVSGGNDPISTQCMVCHDMSLHIGGTVRLKNADTGATILYNSVTPSTTELFCLSCHDNSGALFTFISGGTPTSPFNDGSVLGQTPYRAGIDIADHWSKTFGHRQKGLTCLGTGAPGTGCHANGHGAPAVGILARNLQIPQPDRYRETDFAICLDCHQSYATVSKEAIFGVKFTEVVSGVTITHPYDWGYGPPQNPLLRSDPADVYSPPYNLSGGIQTHFRDQNYDGTTGKSYDDPAYFFGDFFNLHWFHTGSQTWGYRGTAPNTGISCLACHSVHGTNTQWGMVHDQLQYGETITNGDSYGRMSGNPVLLNQYPTYCMINCHAIIAPTSNWFMPTNE